MQNHYPQCNTSEPPSTFNVQKRVGSKHSWSNQEGISRLLQGSEAVIRETGIFDSNRTENRSICSAPSIQRHFTPPSAQSLRRGERHTGSRVCAPAARSLPLDSFKRLARFQESVAAISRLGEACPPPTRRPCTSAALIQYRRLLHQSQTVESANLTRGSGVEVLRLSYGLYDVSVTRVKVGPHLICCFCVFKWTSPSELTR